MTQIKKKKFQKTQFSNLENKFEKKIKEDDIDEY